MSEQNQRIIGTKVDLDYQTTREFFSQRATRVDQVGLLSVTMYQDNHPELVKERNRTEKAKVIPRLELNKQMKVLDIGCGTGRWGLDIIDQVHSYLGVDFSSELIKIANRVMDEKKTATHYVFQTLAATEIGPDRLQIAPPFDLIIIAGLLLYLNDQDCSRLLAKLPGLCNSSATIYIREPVAVEQRLTLCNHYSEELAATYNAIYRTEAELQTEFSRRLLSGGFRLLWSDDLFPASLQNRSDTKQKIYLFNRGLI